MKLCFLDVETKQLEASPGSVIEVASLLWDVPTHSVLSAWSELVQGPAENAAESTNGIPPALLPHGMPWERVAGRLEQDVRRADVLLAHNADFDRAHLAAAPLSVLEDARCPPFICTMVDILWPRPSSSMSLIAIALAHKVGVADAHRALTDVWLMARLFERASELGVDIDAMIARGLRPKGLFKALVPYEERALPKAAHFRWNDPVEGAWTKRIALEDVGLFGFPLQRIGLDGEPWLDPAFCNHLHPTRLQTPPLRCQKPTGHDGPHLAMHSPQAGSSW
jgi:DNA polymerase III subunit epsilon